MSNEITDAERWQWVKNNCLIHPRNILPCDPEVTQAEIDAAILAERKPVVERSTWQNVYPAEKDAAERTQWPNRLQCDAFQISSYNRIAVLRRDFWSNGDVTCDLERP